MAVPSRQSHENKRSTDFVEIYRTSLLFFFSFKRSALIWFDSERRGTVLSFVFDMKRVFKMGLERFESLLQPCVRGVRVGYPCSGGFLQVFLSQLNPLLPFTLLITASWAMGITHLAARWYFPVDRSVSQSVSQQLTEPLYEICHHRGDGKSHTSLMLLTAHFLQAVISVPQHGQLRS